MHLKIKSESVKYTDEEIVSTVPYHSTTVEQVGDTIEVVPKTTEVSFKTERKVPRTGLMLVGWGGNNGTTVTASIFANKNNMTWKTRTGVKTPNYFGSLLFASTIRVGTDSTGKDIWIPFSDVLPLVHPNDLVIDGWDISSMNIGDAMARSEVLDYDLQRQLMPEMKKLVPRPSIYFPDFIAANQSARADNVLSGTKAEQMEHIRADIRDFKEKNNLDKVIILWTANTERYAEIKAGLNDTADNLLTSIAKGEEEVSPSTIFAVASILEGCTYINGSPQNTFVPGVHDLAAQRNVYIGGDDFKSGQTKMKSVLVDFLVGAGLKPVSIASYNHLGNNDGKNLSAPAQFKSKEISKSNVVDDMVASNRILYKEGEKPDHCIVIKYLPYVGDSKRALDEYTCEIFMGGVQTISMHNTCEDSLLAAPIIIDLAILAELCQRITYKTPDMQGYEGFNHVLSMLSFLIKAPLVPEAEPVSNALFRQRSCIENFFRCCIGLPVENHMNLETKRATPKASTPLVAKVLDAPVKKVAEQAATETQAVKVVAA